MHIQIEKFIELIGGRKVLITETELTRARISQWVIEGKIPSSWMKFLALRFPTQFRDSGLSDPVAKEAA